MLQEKKQLFSKNYTLKFWTRKGGFFSTVKCKILKSYSQICNVDCRITSFRKTNRCSIPHYLPFPINCTNSNQKYKGNKTKQNWSVFSKKIFILVKHNLSWWFFLEKWFGKKDVSLFKIFPFCVYIHILKLDWWGISSSAKNIHLLSCWSIY